MPIVAKDERKPYTPAPAGVHNAVCVDVVDLGLVDSPWGERPQVEFRWQIDKVNAENGKRFLVVRRFTRSLASKSNLRPFLEGWIGESISEDEAKQGMDLERFVGESCLLQVIRGKSAKGTEFASAKTTLPLPEGVEPLRAKDYIRVIDRNIPQDVPPPDEDEPSEGVPF